MRDSSSGLSVTEPTSLAELPELVFLCLLSAWSLLSVGFFSVNSCLVSLPWMCVVRR